jgi:hypothetical protein
MTSKRLRVTFADNVPLSEVQEAADCGFGGMGSAYRAGQERVIILHKLEWPYDLVARQLTALQKDGYLRWEET